DFGPERAEDELPAVGRVDGLDELGVLPGVHVVRSSGGLSSSSSANSGTVGCCWPDATLTVEWTIGTPNALAVLTVETMFLRSRVSSTERTVPNCDGW